MCEFVSWIEKGNRVYFLRDDEIEAKGWEFINSVGHSAIEKYYGISGGTHRETPAFPPKEIREAINRGEMKKMTKAGGYKRVEFGDNWSKYEDSSGYWEKKEYDERGNCVKYENSSGYWSKWEYDKRGNEVKFERGWK